MGLRCSLRCSLHPQRFVSVDDEVVVVVVFVLVV